MQNIIFTTKDMYGALRTYIVLDMKENIAYCKDDLGNKREFSIDEVIAMMQ